MGLTTRLSRASAIAFVVALSIVGSMAARGSDNALSKIRISNFGKVNDQYYRGAQPGSRDYADLAALGVRTVVDLREDGDSQEPALVKKAGMNLVRIPMSGWGRPADADVAKFLSIANDPAQLPLFVHCRVGKHRTGVVTAVYRMTKDNWTAAQAYAEMQKYKFDTFLFPHTKLKTFVFDYYTQLQASGATGKAIISR